MKKRLISLRPMQFACLIIFFVEITFACETLVSTNEIGPITSFENKTSCVDYSTYLKRDVCAVGDNFETVWYVKLQSVDGTCLINTTQLRKCEGDCGEKLNLLGSVNLTCSEGFSECSFKYEIGDCQPKVDWVEVSTCNGTNTHAKRMQKCMDCDGNKEIDDKFCDNLEHEITVCENSDDYTLWKAGSCSFTYPSCEPNIVRTRECKAVTKETSPALCDNKYVRLELPCSLSYNCCECTNKDLCPDCQSSYIVHDETTSASKASSSVVDESSTSSSNASNDTKLDIETTTAVFKPSESDTGSSDTTTIESDESSRSDDKLSTTSNIVSSTENEVEDTTEPRSGGSSGARKGPDISEIGAQDSNTNTAAAVTVPLVFVFAIAGAAAAFMYKKKNDLNKVNKVEDSPAEAVTPLPEENI